MLFNVEGLDLTAWCVWKLVIHTHTEIICIHIYSYYLLISIYIHIYIYMYNKNKNNYYIYIYIHTYTCIQMLCTMLNSFSIRLGKIRRLRSERRLQDSSLRSQARV